MVPSCMPPPRYDVVIVGGGPAGMSAALILGRARRSVLVLDDGRPRNAPSAAAHGFLTRDGTDPAVFRRIAREEVARYGVEIRATRAVAVEGSDGAFTVRAAEGEPAVGRKLLLATGVEDVLPPWEGLPDLWGRSVFHCPYCDGWEFRDRPLAAWGPGTEGARLAEALRDWSAEVLLCTDGARAPRVSGLRVRTERIARLEGRDGRLERIVFERGEPETPAAFFLHPPTRQRSELPAVLGVPFTRRGAVKTGKHEGTGIPGVWVAGDASRDVQWVVIAAAEGAQAAFAIHRELRAEDRAGRRG